MARAHHWKLAGIGLVSVPAIIAAGVTLPVRALANVAVACTSVALVNAINTANAGTGGVLDLAQGCTYSYSTADNATDAPGNALPVITSAITINGNGSTITRSGATAFRLLDVGAAGALVLNGATVSNGSAAGSGGGILDNGGLGLSGDTISNSTGSGLAETATATANTIATTTFAANTADGINDVASTLLTVTGGSISGGVEGVAANGPVTLDTETIAGATLFAVAAAQLSGNTSLTNVTITQATADGGLETGNGTTTVTDSHFTSSPESINGIETNGPTQVTGSVVSGYGNGLLTSGSGATTVDASAFSTGSNGLLPSGPTTVTDTTVSGFDNGMIAGSGATTVAGSTFSSDTSNGILGTGTSLAVSRSTITGGGSGVVDATAVTASTVTGNTTSGVTAAAGGATITDSIISSNAGANCTGTITDGGHNVDFPGSDASCPSTFTTGDPKLAALADNSGPTPTMLPLDGSAAEGSIPAGAAGCTASDIDQRGVPRLQNGLPCDSGAVELAATALTLVGSSDLVLTAGDPLTLSAVIAEFNSITGGPSGPVNFYANGALVGTSNLLRSAANFVSFSSSTLAVGTYTFVAQFLAAPGYLASTSNTLTVVITPTVPDTGAAAGAAGPSPAAPAALILAGVALLGAAVRRRRTG